jgi:hypothetical protein
LDFILFVSSEIGRGDCLLACEIKLSVVQQHDQYDQRNRYPEQP